MKEKFKKEMFKFVCLFVSVLFTNTIIAQSENVYSIEKTWSIKGIKALKINPYDVKTQILPSDDNTLKVKLSFEAISEKDGEIDKLKAHLENVVIQEKETELKVTNHGTKKATYVNIEEREKAKLVFDNGRVKLRSLNWKLLEIYVPNNVDIKLHAYFSKVFINYPFKEQLTIYAFESQIKAEKYEEDLVIKDGQFSKFYFGSLKDVDAKINESDFSAESINHFVLDSKFSDVELTNCNSLSYSGFEDEIKIDQIKKATIKSNFSDLTIHKVDEILGDLVESSLIMKHCNDAVFDGKYSDIEAKNMELLKLRNCVETEVNIQEADHIYSLYGQFNEFNIDYLKGFFSTYQSTEEEIEILKTAQNFKGIVIDGKFCDAKLNLDKSSNYTLKVDVQFSDIELEKNLYQAEMYDKEYSNLKLIYHYGEAKKNSNVNIKGTEMDIEIFHGKNFGISNNTIEPTPQYLNGWILIERDNLYGFTDANGKEIIYPLYEKIYDFGEYQNHWAKVEVDGLYGFIDDKGKKVFHPMYDVIHPFGEYQNNWALVEIDGLFGFINSDGKEVIYPMYDRIYDFGEYRNDWALVEADGMFGFINSKGKEIVAPIYDSIEDLGSYKEGK